MRQSTFWIAYAIIVFFQLITNGILTGIPIVRYDAAQIIGWRVVYAPVEDLLFGFALVLVHAVVVGASAGAVVAADGAVYRVWRSDGVVGCVAERQVSSWSAA